MTTELEQEFFKVFKVEPISKWHKCKDYSCVCCDEYDNCSKREFIYPEITDRKLLEMICILVKTQTSYPINKSNIKDIKDEVLRRCINLKSYIAHQIQQLFKEKE